MSPKKLNLLSLIFLFLITAFPLFAQSKYFVSGFVVDKQGSGMEYVDVLIKNDAFKANTLTDKDGAFSYKLEVGHYTMQGIYFGTVLFEKSLNVSSAMNLGKIAIDPSYSLNEIVVKTDRPLVKKIADKLIFNAQNFKGIEGYKASEILKYLPTVIISPDGEVMMENKAATIFLNGRQLSKEEAHTYLQNMNAKDIDKIEIQSSHGGTNDANILGGVINVITKKSQTGFNTSLQTHNSFFREGYYQCLPSINLFYGKDNWNLYSSYSYYNERNQQTAETISSYKQDSTSHVENSTYFSHRISHHYRVGMMGILGKVHTFGIELNGIKRQPTNNPSQGAIDLYKNQQKIDDAKLESQYQYNSDFYNLVTSYIWRLDSLNSSFKILANYNNKSDLSSNLVNVKYQINPNLNVNEEDLSQSKAKNY